MDPKSLAEQERDIRDLLRRAERTPVKASALRRDTLRRLIDLAHSPHPSLKIIAATNLKLFIRDFPDLEDDAINAVYDLCEDPVAGVRIKGYAAIVDVSREQSKWVKRNADVLVQLLQSDEPEEVTFVKRALTQHLDMDPVVTLGVLCDQVIPSDEPLDEEELAIRDRIRSLVLAFLAGEARRPLIDRHANCLDSPAEAVLVSGLFKAITKLAPSDVIFIVKDIITSLPSFTPYAPRGKELLDILLAQVRAAFTSDIPSDVGRGSLISSSCYLDLAFFITVERRLAHPSHIFRFYHTILVETEDLPHLSEEEQCIVIRSIARILAACEEIGECAPPTAPAADIGRTADGVSSNGDDASLWRQCFDIFTMLLRFFADMALESRRPWEACLTLVQVVARRQRDGRWRTFQAISSTLERIGTLYASQEASVETKAAQEQVHSLIRSFVQPVKPPVSSTMALASGPQAPSRKSSSAEDGPKAGTSARVTLRQGDQRGATNASKRKLDAPNGLVPSSTPSVPGQSRSSAGLTPPKGAHGQPTFLPLRPSPATVSASGRGAPKVPCVSPLVPDVATSNLQERSFDAPPLARADGSTLHFVKKVQTDGREANGGQRGRTNLRSDPVVIARSLQVLGAAATRGKAPEAALPRVEDATAAPSLLSRLAGQAGGGPGAASPTPDRDQLQMEKDRRHGRRSKHEPNGEQLKERPKSLTTSVVPAKRPVDTSPLGIVAASTAPSLLTTISRRNLSLADSDKDPVIGFSIRGAAKAAHAASTKDDNPGVGSLLERLQASEEAGSEWGGRRKKRTKHS